MRVILRGDQGEAGNWLGFAKNQARLLLGQGPNLNRVLTPTSDVTIRIQTLTTTDARITITAGGADYVTEFQVNEDGSSLNLWTGRLRSGAATVRGKSVFAIGQPSFLTPVGDGAFIAGPEVGAGGGASQLIATQGGVPRGSAFAPYSPPAGYSLRRACYSGLYDTGEADENGVPYTEKRMHLLYYRYVHIAGDVKYPQIQPTVLTSIDSGRSFFTTEITIPSEMPGPGAPLGAEWIYAETEPFDMVFLGNNRITALCRMTPTFTDFSLDLSGASPWWGVVTLKSNNGGASWSAHFTSWNDLGFLRIVPSGFEVTPSVVQERKRLPKSLCYIGGDSLLAIGLHTDSTFVGNVSALIRSDDAGATWYVVHEDFPVAPPTWGGLIPLGPDSCGYIVQETLDTTPGNYRKLVFNRTVNGGATWTRTFLPDFMAGVMPWSLTMTAALKPPATLPTGKVAADYAQLAVFCREPPTVDTPQPSWRIALSTDGGATWTLGGIVSSSKDGTSAPLLPGKNLGMMNKNVPAFPAFPDLHKNGLPI